MNKTILICVLAWFGFGTGMSAQNLWSQLELPTKRFQMGAAALGSKIYFAGGAIGHSVTSKVDIYDTRTGVWTQSRLSEARNLPAGVGVGQKVIFAGGLAGAVTTDAVDIFDTISGQWNVAKLSVPRFSMAALRYGTRALFAGGSDFKKVMATVDIYDAETGAWTLDSLSEPRAAMAAAVVGTKAVFAGGYRMNSLVSDRVDIYDFNTGLWDTATLSQPRGFLSAAVAGGKVIIAGGLLASNDPTDVVDIYDPETGIWSVSRLSTPRGFIDNAASVCDKAFFVGGCLVDYSTNFLNHPMKAVDIYDPVSGRWQVEFLSHQVVGNVVISNGDQLFSAGGSTNPTTALADLSTIDVYTCSSSAVTERVAGNTELEVYPNPASDIIQVRLKNPNCRPAAHLRLLDARGNIMLEQAAFSSGENIPVSMLPGGWYLVEWIGTDVFYRAPLLIVD